MARQEAEVRRPKKAQKVGGEGKYRAMPEEEGIARRKPRGGNCPPKDFFPCSECMHIVRVQLATCSPRIPSTAWKRMYQARLGLLLRKGQCSVIFKQLDFIMENSMGYGNYHPFG